MAFNIDLIKAVYFYVIVAGCVLFLSIGSYWLIRANLIRYVFPEADNYYSYPTRVGYYDCQAYLDLPNKNTEPGEQEPQLTSEQKELCKVEQEKERELQKVRRYQEAMLSSMLMIVISSIVLFVHLKFVKIS